MVSHVLLHRRSHTFERKPRLSWSVLVSCLSGGLCGQEVTVDFIPLDKGKSSTMAIFSQSIFGSGREAGCLP